MKPLRHPLREKHFADWPLGERTSPPMVWTGTELVVWGGGIYDAAGDGAAFNLAKGTWRVIAQAPIGPRETPAVAWTGTEMLVWGGRDPVLPVSHAHAAAESLPGCHLVVVPRAGHLPHRTDPVRFADAVTAFVAGTPSAPHDASRWKDLLTQRAT